MVLKIYNPVESKILQELSKDKQRKATNKSILNYNVVNKSKQNGNRKIKSEQTWNTVTELALPLAIRKKYSKSGAILPITKPVDEKYFFPIL